MRVVALGVPVIASLGFSACYLQAHAPPKRASVAREDGAKAEYAINDSSYFSESQLKRVTSSTYGFRYGGRPITYGEYRSIVDPKYGAMMDRYERLYRKCENAKVAKYIAYGALAAAVVVVTYGALAVTPDDPDAPDGKGETPKWVWYTGGGLAGLGVGSYVTGYFLGGHACSTAGRMWDGAAPWLEYHDSSPPNFDDLKEEMRTLTESYNRQFGNKPAGEAPSDE
jgi:hypothetical protein